MRCLQYEGLYHSCIRLQIPKYIFWNRIFQALSSDCFFFFVWYFCRTYWWHQRSWMLALYGFGMIWYGNAIGSGPT